MHNCQQLCQFSHLMIFLVCIMRSQDSFLLQKIYIFAMLMNVSVKQFWSILLKVFHQYSKLHRVTQHNEPYCNVFFKQERRKELNI